MKILKQKHMQNLNRPCTALFFQSSGAEGGSSQAKVVDQGEVKSDAMKPDSQKDHHDYSDATNRARLYEEDAVKAIVELKAAGLHDEATRLQNFVDKARENETEPSTNREVVATQVRKAIDTAMRDPLVSRGARLSLYNQDAPEVILSLRSQGRVAEATLLEKAVMEARNNETSATPIMKKISVARAIQSQVKAARDLVDADPNAITPNAPLADATQVETFAPGEIKSVNNPPGNIRSRFNDLFEAQGDPSSVTIPDKANNLLWTATNTNSGRPGPRKLVYTKRILSS